MAVRLPTQRLHKWGTFRVPTLSRRFVENEIEYPVKGQVIYRDDKLPGFALRVTRGCKSYIVECRVNGANRRITIGKHGI